MQIDLTTEEVALIVESFTGAFYSEGGPELTRELAIKLGMHYRAEGFPRNAEEEAILRVEKLKRIEAKRVAREQAAIENLKIVEAWKALTLEEREAIKEARRTGKVANNVGIVF